MQKRRLGRSDLYLTPLGLGTWAIGGPWAYGWGPQDAANLAFAEGLRRIAEGERCSLAGLAIAWVLRRPEINSAIVGARSPAQIAETVKYVDQALSVEVLGEIERLLGEREGLCRERRPVERP
ncbi:MAG: aldo/keto reductase [Pseudomonadota bacterium]|nr:aldo/keto reductase [Gammaproteobacteria bacterium]MDQ3581729.1 aldo/keto reductase [Pseudomonadota bacterium]